MRMPSVLEWVKGRGYTVFESDHSPYNLNIVGIRSSDAQANSFNDIMFVGWKYLGAWYTRWYPITTDPGTYYRENPLRVDGTAILIPGQYRGAYALGKHKGQYDSLVQVKPVKVWRDNNKNETLDWSGDVHQGLYGINIHRATANGTSTEVNKWSAGCQVFADAEHFKEFMNLVRQARNTWGNSFTYTLLD